MGVDQDNDDLLAETVSGVRAGLRSASRWAVIHVVYPAELAGRMPMTGSEPLLLGRNPGPPQACRIAHRTVSRTHLRVMWDARARGHVAVDAGSRNGSWIDGVQVTDRPHLLRDGSVLRLGDVLAVFEGGEGNLEDDDTVDRAAVPGQAALIGALRASIGMAAVDPSPVLIIGETGVGKELCAAEIHRLSGRTGPMVTLNCAELNPTVIESQLFGHEKGAFTGAAGASSGLFRAADGGSLFLDEIGELPIELQPKLLRVIQTGEVLAVGGTRKSSVDVRVMAATNRALSQEVRVGGFRRDLYARLSLWEMTIPPVRRRRADVLAWVRILHRAWLQKRNRTGRDFVFEPDAAEALLLHPWPENLRGIDRLVHALAGQEQQVMLQDLPSWLALETLPEEDSCGGSTGEVMPARRSKRPPIPSREELMSVLEQHDWVVRAVAKHFGRDRRQVYRWLDNYGIRRG